MVVSLDPTTGAVSAASIPRDTANFPTSSKAIYRAKINGLYQSLMGRIGQPKAAAEMKRIIGDGIGVEIDSYAVVGFEGVRQLVNAVGGVDVVLARSVSDPFYWVTSKKRGVFFPAGTNHLSGDRALIFARTRKGDNDFERARRQQLLVAGAVSAVRDRGLRNLDKLLPIANRFVKTDLPLKAAPILFGMVSSANLGGAEKVVFGPTEVGNRRLGNVLQPEAGCRPRLDRPVDGAGRCSRADAAADTDPRSWAGAPDHAQALTRIPARAAAAARGRDYRLTTTSPTLLTISDCATSHRPGLRTKSLL